MSILRKLTHLREPEPVDQLVKLSGAAVFDKMWFLAWYQEIVNGEIDIRDMAGAGCSLKGQDAVLVEQARYLHKKNQQEKGKK